MQTQRNQRSIVDKSGEFRLASANYRERLRMASACLRYACALVLYAAATPARMAPLWMRKAPERLVIAPQDISTADPTRADDIYAGYFAFEGRTVCVKGQSPFDVEPPSAEWARALAGFGWLRHLRAADTALARANAQALVEDYLHARQRRRWKSADDPMTIVRRLLSWLSQSPMILASADGKFYRRFLRMIARDAAYLQASMPLLVGADRLWATIAIAEFAICTQVPLRFLNRASTQLAHEIERQILSDGGHISRSPPVLVDLLLDLLPLRQSYSARSTPIPQALISALDRMPPMIRMLRHPDGALALFNGMGVTQPDSLAVVLAYEDARGPAPFQALASGYQRIQAGDSLVILDVGAPPPTECSYEAHAGCLSFEYSLGIDRVVVNCGTLEGARINVRRAMRQTAAHSTLTIDDTSSCRIAPDNNYPQFLAGAILSGPNHCAAKRREGEEGIQIDSRHDGYVERFGLIHTRKIGLSSSGKRLVGEDRLKPAKTPGSVVAQRFVLRFHLHPLVSVLGEGPNREILLETANGRRLTFWIEEGIAQIEESIFFASPEGPRATLQLAFEGVASPEARVFWEFNALDQERFS